MDRRLIEETFPIKEVSKESKKEDGIKNGHIKTFHKWWARRPLSVSRSTIICSLIKSNEKKILDKTFNYSLSYDVQDQISDTKKQENKSIDNLLNKTYQELLILITKNII